MIIFHDRKLDWGIIQTQIYLVINDQNIFNIGFINQGSSSSKKYCMIKQDWVNIVSSHYIKLNPEIKKNGYEPSGKDKELFEKEWNSIPYTKPRLIKYVFNGKSTKEPK